MASIGKATIKKLKKSVGRHGLVVSLVEDRGCLLAAPNYTLKPLSTSQKLLAKPPSRF